MKKYLYIVLALVMLLATACAADETDALSAGETEDGVSMTFAFGSVDGALDLKKLKTFRIRIYTSTPYSDDETPLFDSLKIHGCFAASGTDVRIQDLKAGVDRFVFYEGFSDDACAERVAVGIRGGVTIAKETELQQQAKATPCTADDACQSAVHPDARCDCDKDVDSNGKTLPYCKGNATSVCTVSAPVYIPLFEVGKFNAFPMPSDDLKSEAALQSCDSDIDCAEVHAAATCDPELGYCTVEGLFPFSPSRARAFHSAEVTEDGTILFSGGFNRTTVESFYAGAPFFEAYDPYAGLFAAPLVQENYGGQNVGLHRTTLLDGDRLVVSGGISEVKLGYEFGDDSITLRMTVPHEYEKNCPDTACTNFSRNLLAANLTTGTVVQGMLPYRTIFHRSSYAARGEDGYLLLTGGMTFSDAGMASPVNQHVLCTAADILAEDPNMSCAMSENADGFPPRFGQADACLVGGTSKPCSEYFVFGGVDEGEAPGEVFSSTDDPFNTLLSFSESTSLAKAHLSEVARVESGDGQPAKLYSFGGVSNVARKNDADNSRVILDFGSPDVQPAQVNVNLSESSMTTAQMDLTALDDAGEAYRLFHTVSILDGGRIMLAGGLGEDGLPTKSVLFFEEPATHALTYINKINMTRSRFGHTATVLQHGLLEGAVLVVGGFTIADTDTGTIQFAEGAEIYIPAN